jgi:flagellum-specific ATP synthase
VTLDADKYAAVIASVDPITLSGKVSQVIGLVIESEGPAVSIGENCMIENESGTATVRCEVVGFRDKKVLLMPLGHVAGIAPGSRVIATREPLVVHVGHELLGRVINGLGQPIDGAGPIDTAARRTITQAAPDPMKRRRITEPLATGIRAIDGMLTCGKGQRVGIFSGSGVGKSVLLGMVARNSEADVNVIALVGERGRELRDFLDKDLKTDGLKRSVVVAVTSDQPSLIRVKGAMTATAIAEYFRDMGLDVMLMMDSVTRVAMAQREIGLAIGEPPTSKGYTPSVFAFLPRLLERSGTSDLGSITGLYTVLVEGDDMTEPVADAVRSILDGHIVLSRKLANQNHYPAVDVLESVSRLMIDVVGDQHAAAANRIREILATYRESEDLINIGAYNKGSNPKIDLAIERIGPITEFLRQGIADPANFDDTVEDLIGLAA